MYCAEGQLSSLSRLDPGFERGRIDEEKTAVYIEEEILRHINFIEIIVCKNKPS